MNSIISFSSAANSVSSATSVSSAQQIFYDYDDSWTPMRVKPCPDYWGRLNTNGVTSEMVNSYSAKSKSVASMKVFTTNQI